MIKPDYMKEKDQGIIFMIIETFQYDCTKFPSKIEVITKS
jgi:hypothetical protein